MCHLFGEVLAAKMRVQPGEIDLPAGCRLRSEYKVVEDVSEDQPATARLGSELEALRLSGVDPSQATGRIDLRYLERRA